MGALTDGMLSKSQFLQECFFDDFRMKKFKKIHPKQLISRHIPVPIWDVHYQYVTARGNMKEADKYVIDYDYSADRVETEFLNYIQNENINHPERKVSNVEILDMSFMGEVSIELN